MSLLASPSMRRWHVSMAVVKDMRHCFGNCNRDLVVSSGPLKISQLTRLGVVSTINREILNFIPERRLFNSWQFSMVRPCLIPIVKSGILKRRSRNGGKVRLPDSMRAFCVTAKCDCKQDV